MIDVAFGEAFSNAFWVFVGVVAGALIQHFLGWIQLRKQRSNAKRLFKVETTINRNALDALAEALKRKKERFVAGQQGEADYYIDMSAFNYRIVDPLINAGHFHDLLGPEGVQRYFRYAGELNTGNAQSLISLLRQEADAGKSLAMLDWLIETKLEEWNEHLSFVEELVGETKNIPRRGYVRPKQIVSQR